ncbi:Dirigent protein 4 [Hibiscus syriacus]|uniref:Dirigent protein n=1 Tax=Hibiscus syriacus TaxID=106335 RepID=A0A6A3BA02_HIBSY|nr:dirigent protein 4-like [Hibiscus syriacus]KAE8711719.1 Dirigent protein 4 [Hibiscus syriacus]
MEKSLILALVLVLGTAVAVAPCRGYYSGAEPYVPAPKKVTHLHFFLQDIMSGENPSAVVVARPNVTTASNDTFGSVVATDDLLTIGPNVTSGVIGNAQGLWVSTGREVSCLTVYMDFGFTVGEFNGSSISIFSRNPVSQTERELAVVGGRGKFRMAQGYAQLKTYYVNFTTGDAIVEYKVTVIH